VYAVALSILYDRKTFKMSDWISINCDQIKRNKGDFEKMKRAIFVIFSIITVCSLCLAGTVNAAKPGYSFIVYQESAPTVNGQVAAGEWTDAYIDFFYSGWTMTTNLWAVKWSGTYPNIHEYWCIEIFTDTTNDAGDFFQISMDTAKDNAATPQTDDFLINYTAAGIMAYKGTGTDWALFTGYVVGTDITIATSFSASPKGATPHRIIEIDFYKVAGTFGLQINNNARVAYYDASNPSQGVIMWPPYSSADVPNTYGDGTSDIAGGTIPEGLTIGVMVLLSSFAVIVSTRYFRKHPKI
jgi:hypothetical protein